MDTLRPHALGLGLALYAALGMLVMSLLALAGYYTEAYTAMQSWHYWADLTLLGIIGGMVEAGVWSYISGVIIAWFYNMFAK